MLGQEAGQQLNHVLQQAVQIQLKQLAVPILSILHAVYQAARLGLKHTVPGLNSAAVSKVNVPGQGAGQQYKLILILAVTALQQKLMEQILNIRLAVQLDVLLVIEITVHGEHGAPAVRESKLELEHGPLLRHV